VEFAYKWLSITRIFYYYVFNVACNDAGVLALFITNGIILWHPF